MTSSNLTTKELVDLTEDMMREQLKDFNAAVDALQKRQAEFKTEHPNFGFRYS